MNPYSPPGLSADAYPAPPPYAASSSNGAVSDTAVDLLRQTRPWVVLLSIFLLLASALIVVLAVLVVAASAFMPGTAGTPVALGLIYLPIGLVYVYPGLKLLGYGSAIARLTQSRAVSDLESALAQQKSFWKFCGVASIVVIAIYAVGLVVLIAVGAAKAIGMAKGQAP